ncbi:MAG: hypothetical protein ACRCS8_06615 [Brevinema sp.]
MIELQNIYHLFLQYPYLNAVLVFDDLQTSEFIGVLLKKDIENALKSQDNFLIDKISKVSKDSLEQVIFNESPKITMKAPFISLMGEIQDDISYDEFVSEFFPEEVEHRLSLQEVFYDLNHPLMILNRFKRILYLNRAAEELLSEKARGEKVSDVMLAFQLNCDDERIYIHRQEEIWKLIISESKSKSALHYIYQMIPVS